jgi:uncharacterized protein
MSKKVIVHDDDCRYMMKENKYKVRILMVDKKNKHKVLQLLLRCMSSNNDVFYNINEGDDEMSLVIDTKFDNYTKKVPCVFFPDVYRVLQIHEGCSGINHIGIVSEISSLFSDIHISIFYINTYNNNFILVKEKDYNRAKNALKSLGIKFQSLSNDTT